VTPEIDPAVKLPAGVKFINPYLSDEVSSVLKSFTDTYYTGKQKRILILGINPGRFGSGITGIPFTDPVALEDYCGINNTFSKKKELSSDFVYRMIDAFGGPELFYKKFLISSVCPIGFLKGNLNYNYYDSPELIRSVESFIRQSLSEHMKMNLKTDVVISLGKKNALFLNRFNAEMKLFGNVVNLEHPRYIMQYKRKQLNSYIREYLAVLSAC
jgi:hypothetical protein